MWLFLWDSEPSKIFVGDTQISKVFLWDTQVRPSGWKPWANTIWYRPLTSETTINNQVTGGTNLTNLGVTFWTANGVDCATFSGNPDTNHTVMQRLYWTITWLPTWANPRTFCYWVYNSNNAETNNYETYIFQWQWSTNKMVLIASSKESRNYWISQWWALGTFWTVLREQRCHHCIVYDWSKFTWYVNGVSTWDWTYTINTWNTYFSLWSGRPDDTAWASFNWNFSRLIIEDKARTAQEVADYYNQTKANYGL